MTRPIETWLKSIGLGQYVDVFERNAIDFAVLGDLTEAHLKELDIPLGHRLRVIKAIEELEHIGEPKRPLEGGSRSVSIPAERRQLTVLFCDLVESTELSRRLDPEDMREVMRHYQDAVAGAIARYDGYLAKYLGDGVLAYFGWPHAYEDQAERAVLAALDAVQAVGSIEVGNVGRELRARVGAATGEVVIGDLIGEGSRETQAVTGETPNLAARLQAIATPGQVVVGQTTKQLIGSAFSLRNLGEQKLKGFSEPVSAWQVQEDGEQESRFVASRNVGLSSFVGREHELGLLLERWEDALASEGRIVLISGEPGIGKSRLVAALQDKLAEGTFTRLFYQCSPYHSNSALYPIARQIERAAGFKRADSDRVRLDRLEQALQRSDGSDPVAIALVADLLGLDCTDRYAPVSLSSPQRKERLIRELCNQLHALTTRQPVLVLLEDAHWIDPTTLELFERIVSDLDARRILILVTHRPDWQSSFSDDPSSTVINLNRLNRRQVRRIIEAVGNTEANSELVDQLIERSDGNPLYAEELAKSIAETRADGAEFLVPISLQASFLARLDRLGEARTVAQFASVLGRDFSYALLAETCDVDGDKLDSALQELTSSGLIRQSGALPDASFTFKHVLAQDAIYGSLLKTQRRSIHEQIARRLGGGDTRLAKGQPELLAHHQEAAGHAREAVDSWHRAAQVAAANSANQEAAAHCARALALLSSLTENAERDQRELDLLILAGPQQMLSTGLVTREAETIYRRAVELSEKLGNTDDRFQSVWGLWHVNEFRAEWKSAIRTASVLAKIAEETGNNTFRLQAHHANWSAMVFSGDIQGAINYSDRGLNLYDPEIHRDQAQCFGGHDPGVCGFQMRSLCNALSARVEAADTAMQRALALADHLEQPASTSMVHFFSGVTLAVSGHYQKALEHAEQAVEIARRHRILPMKQMGRILRGWARVHNGDMAGGLAELEELLNSARRKPRKRALMPAYLGLLADAYLHSGKPYEAMAAIEDGLARVKMQEEHLWESDLLRLKGTLLSTGSRDDQIAGLSFIRRAYQTAREKGAYLFALSAAAAISDFPRDLRMQRKMTNLADDARALAQGVGGNPTLNRAVERCLAL